MAALSIDLLGPFQATLNGRPLTSFRHSKVKALLIYLAVEQRSTPARRESLMALLWPDILPKSAQQNLRQALYYLRKAVGTDRDGEKATDFLLADHKTVVINPTFEIQTDTQLFSDLLQRVQSHQHAHLHACPYCRDWLQEAIDLYRGDFLADFYLPDSSEFEDWAQRQREEFRRGMQDALYNLTTIQLNAGDFNQAQAHSQRQLAIDGLNERANQQLMEALARNGQRSEALAEYERFRLLLQKELGVEPEELTTTLYQKILQGTMEIPSPIPSGPSLAHVFLEQGGIRNARTRLPSVQENLVWRVSPTTRHKQLVLLEKVRRFWIEGVLERSQQNVGLIEMPIDRTDWAINQPWRDVIGPAIGDSRVDLGKAGMVEIFRQCDRSLLILGEPGAGKTTLLLGLARDLISLAEGDPGEPIPVILNLASWVESKSSLGDWVLEEMTAKYQIPRRTSHKWLRRDDLTLLLDGFDEVPARWRGSCLQELNSFRDRQGLTGIVVCSRSEEYLAANVPLRLGGAITLQPLTIQQVDAYLAAAGDRLIPLRTVFNDDQVLQALAQSPLMLNLMDVAFSDQPVEVSEDAADRLGLTTSIEHHLESAPRERLFELYARQALQRRGARHSYDAEQTTGWLSWLASEMLAHNQSTFLIEQMQPSWLPGRFWQWLYLLAFGLTNGLLVGVALWLFLLLLNLRSQYLPAGLSILVARLLQITPGQAELLTLLAGNLILGLLTALIVGWHYERRRGQAGGASNEGWLSQILAVGLVTGLTVTAFVALFSRPLWAISWGIIETLVYTVGTRFVFGWSFRKDIRTVEALGWSWSAAVNGLIIGLLLAAIAESIGYLFNGSVTLKSVVPLGLGVFVLGGIQGRRIEEKNRPNQGIILSLRNALIAGLVVASVGGLTTALVFGLRYAFLATIVVFAITTYLYGGANVMKHFILRLLLWERGYLPWNFAHFLDYTARLAFLRKVGGGYIFVHRLLMEYFASRWVKPRGRAAHPVTPRQRPRPASTTSAEAKGDTASGAAAVTGDGADR